MACSIAITGCASTAGAEEEAGTGTEPTPAVVSIPKPDLGPVPEGDPPLTEAESEAARIDQVDQLWLAVLARYPDAARTDVAFEGYVTSDTHVEVMRACYEAAGLPIDEGRAASDPDGPVISVGTSTDTEAEAVAQYVCQVAHPFKVVARGPNNAELGWLYDYLTEFYAPCLAANGIENPPPPSRSDFVENWPNQGWFPSPFTMSEDPMSEDPAWEAALNEACPKPEGAMQAD